MIYLVEDDESIRELVVYTLNSQGLEAQGFERPSLFWKALEKRTAFTGASGHYASGGRRTVYFKKNPYPSGCAETSGDHAYCKRK